MLTKFLDRISMSELSWQKIPYCGAAKENERCPNVFVRSLRIHKILLSEEERKILLGVYTESNSDK